MMRYHTLREKKEKAQGMVEFALILPLLLLLIVGVVEFGRFLFHFSSVTSASREAARYGSAVGRINGVERYADCDGIRNAARRAGSFANLDDTDITIEYDDGTTLKAATCPPSARINLADRIVVSVSKEFRPVVAFVNIPFDFPVNSTTARTVIKEVGVRGTPAPTALPPGSNTLTPTASATSTPTDTPTATPTSTATHIATATEENAPTATHTQIAADTSTPVPSETPTNTPTQTLTYTPTPTATVVAGCAASISGWNDPQNDKITWDLNNIGTSDLHGQSLTITVNNTSAKVQSIYFGASEMWSGNKKTPWTVNLGSQVLPPGGSELTFYFSTSVSTDYMHLSVSVQECDDPVSDDHN